MQGVWEAQRATQIATAEAEAAHAVCKVASLQVEHHLLSTLKLSLALCVCLAYVDTVSCAKLIE